MGAAHVQRPPTTECIGTTDHPRRNDRSAASRTNTSDMHAFSPFDTDTHSAVATAGTEDVTSGPARRRLQWWMLRGQAWSGVAEAPRSREAGVA
jgi:hypothetical protein